MKRLSVILLIFIMMFPAFALGRTEAKGPVTVTDQVGREVTVNEQPQNIVSGYYISSSACIALGLKDNLVAVEAQSAKRPIYKLAAPELIDRPDVGTAKAFNLEACLSVDPDLVILPKKQKDTASSLAELGIPAIVVNPESHEEIIDMFELIGKATGRTKEAKKLIDKYNSILKTVQEKTKGLSDKPVVYMCGTGNYLTTSPKDMYQANLITLAGGINAADELEGSSWKDVSYEQLISFNPDVIIIPTNSNANGTPDYSINDILSDPLLSDIKAVKNKQIYQMPVGLEAWDSPVPSGALGALWMLSTIHPTIFSREELSKTVNEFYKELYNFDPKF